MSLTFVPDRSVKLTFYHRSPGHYVSVPLFANTQDLSSWVWIQKRCPHLKTRTSLQQSVHTHLATMPPAITHDDGFEIALSHQNEQPTIYESVSDSSQGEAPKPMGRFSGTLNKATVWRKTSGKLFQIRLLILREVEFLTANAVRFGLHVATTDGGKKEILLDLILKKTHDTKRKNPTGSSWFDVEMSEASKGTVTVSVTRGSNDPETSVFVPLSGKEGVPYTMEIEWQHVTTSSSVDNDTMRRVTRGMQKASSTPPAVLSGRPAKASKPKAGESTEQSGGSSNAVNSTESAKAESAAEQVATEDHIDGNGSTVESNANGQEQTLGTTDPTKEKPLPIRLRDASNEVAPAVPEDA
jgi:hypothetical protein